MNVRRMDGCFASFEMCNNLPKGGSLTDELSVIKESVRSFELSELIRLCDSIPVYIHGIAHTWIGTQMSCSRKHKRRLYSVASLRVDHMNVTIEWDDERKMLVVVDYMKQQKHILRSEYDSLEKSALLPVFAERQLLYA